MDKIGVRHSSPMIWSLAVNLAVSLTLGVIMMHKVRGPWSQVRGNWLTLIIIGLAVAGVMLFQMNAITTGLVPYIIAVKRTSVIMSSLWGVIFLKEKGGRGRILAIAMMLLGVFVISFG